ncbi:MAG: hypothetical protein AAF208_10135 [Cyanobacteria bacterium P01_A01_bin.45]
MRKLTFRLRSMLTFIFVIATRNEEAITFRGLWVAMVRYLQTASQRCKLKSNVDESECLRWDKERGLKFEN